MNALAKIDLPSRETTIARRARIGTGVRRGGENRHTPRIALFWLDVPVKAMHRTPPFALDPRQVGSSLVGGSSRLTIGLQLSVG